MLKAQNDAKVVELISARRVYATISYNIWKSVESKFTDYGDLSDRG